MPLDRGTVEQQLEALGEGSRWWERRELRDLPAALHADERLLAIAVGKLNRVRWLRRSWLIVVTQSRLLCLQSSSRMSRRQIELPAHQLTRVSIRLGPFRGRVLISTAGEGYGLLVHRADAYKLQTALLSLVPQRELPLKGAWPGAAIGRVFQHVLELPAVALQPNSSPTPAPPQSHDNASLSEQRLQLLEDQVQRLQQQVDFLEELLQQRSHLLDQAREQSRQS